MRLNLILSASVVLLSAVSASAATTTIDFNTLTGASGTPFVSYTEAGYKVAAATGTFEVATTGPGVIGDPLPSIFTFGPASVSVTDGGSSFSFESLDIGNFISQTEAYTLTGILGGVTEFTQSGSLNEPDSTFATINSLHSGLNIDTLQISFKTATSSGENLDNIKLGSPVSVTPEPSSFVLLGTGLLGIAGMMKRRFA